MEVRVQTEEGTAIQDANIEVFQWSSGIWTSLGNATKASPTGSARIEELPTGAYLTVVVRAPGFAPTQLDFQLGKNELRNTAIKLSKAVRSWVKVENENQQPISDARLMRMSFTDTNQSTVYLNSKTLSTLYGENQTFGQINSDGAIQLPPLPSNSKVNVWIAHPQLCQGKKTGLVAREGEIGKVILKEGAKVRIELRVGEAPDKKLDGTKAEVTFLPKKDGSQAAETIIGEYEIVKNAIEFTAAPVEYRFLRVNIRGYFAINAPVNNVVNKDSRLDLRNHKRVLLPVTIYPKVKARGQVVDGAGNPLSDAWVSGQIANPEFKEQADGSAERLKWQSAGNAKTDSMGCYEIDLISGEAQVKAMRSGYFADPAFVHLNVAKSNELPTIKLRPIPRLKGKVLNSSGLPAVGVIVRIRCIGRTTQDPICMTDGNGEFELNLEQMPNRPLGFEGPQTDVFVVAFDPKSKLAGRQAVDLKDPNETSNVLVRLAERESSWIVNPLTNQVMEESEKMKTIVADFEKSNQQIRKRFAGGMVGNRVPDMSNGVWLNTEATSLEDFRGKYVLLDFWFIGCEPCHADMPSVKMAHAAYEDLGFSVVSFHIKSQTPDNVRKFANANDMKYPIVVDNSEGEIEAAYRKLGLSGFPHYILLDPNGKVLINDCFWNANRTSLREHKLELIHQAIHGKSSGVFNPQKR